MIEQNLKLYFYHTSNYKLVFGDIWIETNTPELYEFKTMGKWAIISVGL